MNQIQGLQIAKIAMGGMGLGFSDNKAIFVPFTAIGDVVEVQITLEKKDHAFAKVLTFHERGPGVQDPICEAFGGENASGGCDWLMVDYPTQTTWKDTLVQELFKHYQPETEIYPIVPADKPYHYRNKVFMPVGEDNYGIYARYSHEIVPHVACRIHPPIFDDIARMAFELCKLAKVEPYNEIEHSGTLRHIGLRCNKDASQILLILVTRSARLPFTNTIVRGLTEHFPQITGIVQNINRTKGNVILGEDDKQLWGQNYLEDTLSDQTFRIHYRSFWQVNTGTMENILAAMRAKLKSQSKVIDAYCGIGAIGLGLSDRIGELLGIEEVPEAVRDARANAEQNGIANARFITGKTEQLLAKAMQDFPADAIVLDPPRAGVEESALWAIRSANIHEILYLSCSPMSLARDLKILLTDGKYELASIAAFDMFPNTWHIECLAHLRLSK
ncbi:MAG: 23S rRNA (uracil(1939)-C(5))-methyltransferase RlmD [Synergistaceae bacterium]|jgi:23S rRNA (uracil1939-C5)-methyltransferase|nr:23S rRNA (uracil(1939)-C(5))-methyltransferase RlmD [Candidatus Cloacimonadota bacterium]MCK9243606.1 23S rRNA (uracil(1939)-C(5))-methyltransferase RlmD [Candidatus Cloacimonadota bacterium]MDD3524884.1 23S rRNA (uracil(1939)-C(5))-methyltransferase RlmD [Candidatus Cloacimonadota bacterium]